MPGQKGTPMHSQQMPRLAVDTFARVHGHRPRDCRNQRQEQGPPAHQHPNPRTRCQPLRVPHRDRPAPGEDGLCLANDRLFREPKSKHKCMPYTAEFDLPTPCGPKTRELAGKLRPLIDAIVDLVPVKEWHSVRRWGQVFGVAGTPQVTAEGAIVYR